MPRWVGSAPRRRSTAWANHHRPGACWAQGRDAIPREAGWVAAAGGGGRRRAALGRGRDKGDKHKGKEEAEKGDPKDSLSAPEGRRRGLADGAVARAWNGQVPTANGFIMAIDPTDRRKDSGLAP